MTPEKPSAKTDLETLDQDAARLVEELASRSSTIDVDSEKLRATLSHMVRFTEWELRAWTLVEERLHWAPADGSEVEAFKKLWEEFNMLHRKRNEIVDPPLRLNERLADVLYLFDKTLPRPDGHTPELEPGYRSRLDRNFQRSAPPEL